MQQREPDMARDVVRYFLIALSIFGLNAVGWAQDIDAGKSEYQAGCATCHGVDGKGKGSLSAQLNVVPADLTVLAKKNHGVFPVSAVYDVIDGRKAVIAHGARDMPIWGNRFTPDPNSALSPNPLNGYVELSVRTRILAVIDYLNRIQEK
jgi:mono/diheme cytochrome c family protein